MKSKKRIVSCLMSQGFTIIELLVVIALFIIFGTLALVMSMDSYRGYSFRSETSIIASVLEHARNQSMVNLDQAPHGVHINATTGYTIFEGATYHSASPLNQVMAIGSAVAITPATTDIIFDQISGSVTTPETITVTSGNRSSVITINSEGGIMW